MRDSDDTYPVRPIGLLQIFYLSNLRKQIANQLMMCYTFLMVACLSN